MMNCYTLVCRSMPFGFEVLYPHPQLGSKPLSRSSLQSTHGRLGEHQFKAIRFLQAALSGCRWVGPS